MAFFLRLVFWNTKQSKICWKYSMHPPPGTSVSPVSEECIFYFVETKNWQQVCGDKPSFCWQKINWCFRLLAVLICSRLHIGRQIRLWLNRNYSFALSSVCSFLICLSQIRHQISFIQTDAKRLGYLFCFENENCYFISLQLWAGQQKI